MTTLDMFEELKPARAKPRVLMHVSDATDTCCSESAKRKPVCRMQCTKCNAETDWLEFATITEAKRGIPCPACN